METPDASVVELAASEICFSQASALEVFKDGRSVEGLAYKLRKGLVQADDIPPIKVVFADGRYHSLDNRRLKALKLAGARKVRVSVLQSISLNDAAKFSTVNDGRDIGLRPRGKPSPSFSDSEEGLPYGEALAGFRKRVLTWSVEDIMNDRLFDEGDNKAYAIAELFRDERDHHRAFEWHVLEETRAQLKTGITEGVSGITGFFANFSTMSKEGSKRFRLSMRLDQHPKAGEELVGNDFLVCPDSIEHPPLVAGIVLPPPGPAEERPSTLFELLCTTAAAEIIRDRGRLSFYRVGNLTTYQRIYAALLMRRSLRLFEPILLNPMTYLERFPTPASNSATNSFSLPYGLVKELEGKHNHSQLEAIRAICDPDRPMPVVLLQGPPGTGKTSTIIGALSALLSRDSRRPVLVCSPSNVAVDEVAARVVSHGLVDASGRRWEPYVLLHGNEKKIDLKRSALEGIFLPKRVKRVAQLVGLVVEAGQKLLQAANNWTVFERGYTTPVEAGAALGIAVSDLLKKTTEAALRDLPPDLRKSLAGHVYEVRQPLQEVLPGLRQSSTAGRDVAARLKPACMPLLLLIDGLRDVGRDTELKLIDAAQVVFCTISILGRQTFSAATFDTVIVDEAAQSLEAELLIALKCCRRNLVLVGDPQQLPALVLSPLAVECNYGRSVMQRLMDFGYPTHLLDVQYRMHPDISQWPVAQFYQGRVKDGPNVLAYPKSCSLFDDPDFHPYSFFNIEDAAEELDPDAKSYFNRFESELIAEAVQRLVTRYRDFQWADAIGIISPYRRQVELLTERFQKSPLDKIRVEISTVDGFQGREKDIIIFSAVRANPQGRVGFLKDARRLNVAITRARFALWIFGHKPTLSYNRLWRALFKDAGPRKSVLPVAPSQMLAAERKVQRAANNASISQLFENTRWHMIIGNDAVSALRSFTPAVRDEVLARLLRLASGHRPKFELRSGSEPIHRLIHLYPVGDDLRIVWMVDLDKTKWRQVIRVFDIVKTQQLSRLVERIAKLLKTKPTFVLKACLDDSYDVGERVHLPRQFDEAEMKLKESRLNETAETGAGAAPLEEAAVEESFALKRFFEMTASFAQLILNGLAGETPFKMEPEQEALMQKPGSQFVLGRSGTGKTTMMVFRICALEKARADSGLQDMSSSRPIRQMLVTASPKLCSSIKQYYDRLRPSWDRTSHGAATGDEGVQDMMLDEAEEEAAIFNKIPDSIMDLTNDHFPLFLTFTKFLHMLDRSLGEPFLRTPSGANAWHAEGGSLDGMRALRVTDGETGRALAEDPDDDDDFLVPANPKQPQSTAVTQPSAPAGGRSRSSSNSRAERRQVDFDLFSSDYWPHFPEKLRKSFDCSLVYTEVMSLIKGSLDSLTSPKGYVSKEDYCEISARRSPNFTQANRTDVYQLFELYQKMKRERNEYDIADFVNHVYRTLRRDGYRGPLMSHVYIDEVQDLTQAQIALFRLVCDHLDGFLFAGDTAQTIAKGVNFRFEDLRSMFYHEFLGRTAGQRHRTIAAANVNEVPEVDQLTMNWRTHAGVVNVAASIVELTLSLFPLAIDKLKRETARVAGKRPVFLSSTSIDDLNVHLFGNSTSAEGQEFGAEQAILVRDPKSKERAKQFIRNGLVLTVYEAKGLEFQDVLVFDFFSSSPAREAWRVIYDYIERKGGTVPRHPTFSPEIHNILAGELKYLYVAVTRARQELWFFDENEEYRRPMLDLWKLLQLIQVVERITESEGAVSLARKSTPEQWRRQGKTFFQLHNYEMARQCFLHSGDLDLQLWAEASLARQRAKQGNSPALYQLAAELFLKARAEQPAESRKRFSLRAAECYESGGFFEEAGDLLAKEGESERAAVLYERARCWGKASGQWRTLRRLDNALDCCYQGELFQDGFSMLKEHESHPFKVENPDTILLFARRGALADHAAGRRLRVVEWLAFCPLMTQRKFLERYGYFDELIELERTKGDKSKAAEVLLRRGRFEDASACFLEARQPVKAAECLMAKAKSLANEEREREAAKAAATAREQRQQQPEGQKQQQQRQRPKRGRGKAAADEKASYAQVAAAAANDSNAPADGPSNDRHAVTTPADAASTVSSTSIAAQSVVDADASMAADAVQPSAPEFELPNGGTAPDAWEDAADAAEAEPPASAKPVETVEILVERVKLLLSPLLPAPGQPSTPSRAVQANGASSLAFEADMMLLLRRELPLEELRPLLQRAQQVGDACDQLRVLEKILNRMSGLQSQELLSHLNEMRKLCQSLSAAVRDSFLGKPFDRPLLAAALRYFGVAPHLNPALRLVERTDWLLNQKDVRRSADFSQYFEAPAAVVVKSASVRLTALSVEIECNALVHLHQQYSGSPVDGGTAWALRLTAVELCETTLARAETQDVPPRLKENARSAACGHMGSLLPLLLPAHRDLVAADSVLQRRKELSTKTWFATLCQMLASARGFENSCALLLHLTRWPSHTAPWISTLCRQSDLARVFDADHRGLVEMSLSLLETRRARQPPICNLCVQEATPFGFAAYLLERLLSVHLMAHFEIFLPVLPRSYIKEFLVGRESLIDQALRLGHRAQILDRHADRQDGLLSALDTMLKGRNWSGLVPESADAELTAGRLHPALRIVICLSVLAVNAKKGRGRGRDHRFYAMQALKDLPREPFSRLLPSEWWEYVQKPSMEAFPALMESINDPLAILQKRRGKLPPSLQSLDRVVLRAERNAPVSFQALFVVRPKMSAEAPEFVPASAAKPEEDTEDGDEDAADAEAEDTDVEETAPPAEPEIKPLLPSILLEIRIKRRLREARARIETIRNMPLRERFAAEAVRVLAPAKKRLLDMHELETSLSSLSFVSSPATPATPQPSSSSAAGNLDSLSPRKPLGSPHAEPPSPLSADEDADDSVATDADPQPDSERDLVLERIDEYMSMYCSTACKLRETLPMVLDRLSQEVHSATAKSTKLHKDELLRLDESHETLETIQELLPELDIINPRHEEFEVDWLRPLLDQAQKCAARAQQLAAAWREEGGNSAKR